MLEWIFAGVIIVLVVIAVYFLFTKNGYQHHHHAPPVNWDCPCHKHHDCYEKKHHHGPFRLDQMSPINII